MSHSKSPRKIGHLLLHACKQTFHITKVRTSLKGSMMRNLRCNIFNPEAVVRMCSVEKVFLEISQNSQEHTWVRVSFLIKLQT